MSYKWCAVPKCRNTSLKSPEKLFVSVPKNVEVRRKWLNLSWRDPNEISNNTNIFFCEDHFDMEKDMENYYKYKMGFSKKIILKDKVLPTKFHCQPDRIKRMCDTDTSRSTFVKREEMELVKQYEYIQEPIITNHDPTATIFEVCTKGLATMEDDIDIEEHDLMDNPRIKSIFPDLSCVKMEIPDEEEFVEDNYDELPEEPEPPHDLSYQYEYSFETDHDVPDASAAYEEAGVVYSNQIILGSKPSIDPDILYEEALNSHPVVYLENWEPRLQYSQCFCDTCNILFPTVNALDAHKMSSHSYLIALDVPQKNTARKSTVTSKFCNHCSKMFPDDTSLIKHLYELLPLSNFTKDKEDKNEQKGKECSCETCTKSFPNMASLHWHEKSHTSVGNTQPKKVKISKKIDKTEVAQKIEDKSTSPFKKLNREGKFYSSCLVPKNTLFQCRPCKICFMSCFAAIQHTKACGNKGKVLPSKKCSVCRRKIHSKDFLTHKKQHTYADKLKIYTVYKNIYDKVLCRCPKCQACLDELGFWAHHRICKYKLEKTCYCSDCDIYITANRFESHRGKHAVKKFTKKDFILIEFNDEKVKTITENRLDLKIRRLKQRRHEMYLHKKSKDRSIINVYYCEHCRCCLNKLQMIGHFNGVCKANKIIQQKKICEECGLCFTAKSLGSHLIRHKRQSFTLKDIKIYNLFTRVQIDPPIPELHKCQTCDIHFLYRKMVRRHSCETEKHITCKICSKKFNRQAFNVHENFHSVDTLMPELMEKYKSISNMWSVMYMCIACDLVTMTYDSVVSHSQRHLNLIEADHREYCSVCDLQISMTDFASHSLLHQNNTSIERSSFKILLYDYEELFKREWMSIFRPLPKQQREQILSNSIYRYTRSIKMQVEKSGATDDIHYICMICKSFVEGGDVPQHLKTICDQSNKFICNTCNYTCKTLQNFISHDCENEITPNRSTIVSFNNECDTQFDNKLSVSESQSESAKTSKKTLPDVKKSYIIYKCAKCKVCINLKSSIRRHRCGSESDRTFCRICQQYITSKKIQTHSEAHRKQPSVNKNTLSVVYFNGGEKMAPKSNVSAKIFKCNCGLHFTSLKSIHKHLDLCKSDLEISKEVCSKCKLLFPTDVLVTHLVNHHSKEVKINIVTVSRINLYKCTICTLLFTSQRNYYEHMSDCDPRKGSICVDCKLNFSENCLAKHKCTAKSSHFIKIIKIKPAQIVTVYKCELCNICYLANKSFQYHVRDANHKNKVSLITCKSCGLRFTTNSFHKHEKVHSVGNFYKIKLISAVSGDSVVLNGRNIYTKTTDTTPMKRKLETKNEIEPKKNKTDETLSDRKSRRLMKLQDEPSTSKNDSIDNENENITDTSDVKDDTDGNLISRKLKARISVHNYDKTLYKCIYCNQHFMKQPSFEYHIKAYLLHNQTENYICDICGLHFSKYTLPRHQYIHHERMGLKRDDFVILVDTSFTKGNPIFSKADTELTESKFDATKENEIVLIDGSTEDIDSDANKIVSHNDTCDGSEIASNETEIGRNVSEISTNGKEIISNGSNISRNDSETDKNDSDIGRNDSEFGRNEIDIDRSNSEIATKDNDIGLNNSETNRNGTDIDTDNSEIVTKDSDINKNNSEIGRNGSETGGNLSETNTEVVKNVTDITETVEKVDVIDKKCYYKCADCNVCFVESKVCIKHAIDHTTLDPKMYIQCKLCDFQFMIDSLKDHMELHHSTDFSIESLTIHEYKPLAAGLEPKLDIYEAIDKVQSRLVSTTTDMEVV